MYLPCIHQHILPNLYLYGFFSRICMAISKSLCRLKLLFKELLYNHNVNEKFNKQQLPNTWFQNFFFRKKESSCEFVFNLLLVNETFRTKKKRSFYSDTYFF